MIWNLPFLLSHHQNIGCSTARYDLDQLVQWEGVEWLELINFVRATSLNAQNTHTSVLTSQESPDRVNQPCTPVSDRMGWKPATPISFARFTFAIWKLFFLHTFLRAQTIFLISGKKFDKIHIIFNGNKNIIFQNRVLGNLLFKTDTLFLKMLEFGQTRAQILHK